MASTRSTDAELLAKRFSTTNPADLRPQIGDLQGNLLNEIKHETVSRRGKQDAAYLSRANSMSQRTDSPGRL